MHSPETDVGSTALSEVIAPFGHARLGAARRLHDLGLQLPTVGQLAKDSAQARQRQHMRQIAGDDAKRNQLWRASPAERAQLAAHNSMERAAEPASRGEAALDSRVDFHSIGRQYFNAHSQGKQACRLRRLFRPPGGGVHGFSSEGRHLKTVTCVGAHDPAVLHYANCGFSYWVRKYEVLGDIPNFENRKTLEGFRKHRAAGTAEAGEADGSFSAHMAARDLVVRGVGGGAHANRPALELFYRTYIMGNEHGEAHRLAAFGALVRIRGVAALLRRLRAEPARQRKAMGPVLGPPPPVPVEPSMWLSKGALDGAPYFRRATQWRVVFDKNIVARSRPTTAAPTVAIFQPGDLLWGSGPAREDGWVSLSDGPEARYVLIDATPLGLRRLLERVEPPELAEGACAKCRAAPCYCRVLEESGL